MIARHLEEARGKHGKGRLRIIAHHAHVTPFLTGTHAPGVLGLPGGYPICVRRKSIELDLPDGISRDEAVEFNNQWARADGVEGIESNGTLIYTEDARRTAKPFCAELAEPLSPKHWESRLGAAVVLRRLFAHRIGAVNRDTTTKSWCA